MAVNRQVSDVMIGDTLVEDVHSALGGTIFKKGKVITERDIEVLKAFQIINVTVQPAGQKEKKSSHDQETPEQVETKKDVALQKEFYQLSEHIQKAFLQVKGGNNIPLLEIRKVFEPFVQKVLSQPDLVIRLTPLVQDAKYDVHHAIIVGLMAVLLAKWSRMPQKEYMQVAFAGLFHDIGKLRVHPRIVEKKGTLTVDEFEEMKTHTVNGYHIINGTTGLNEGVALAALQHHERMDGSGYPLSLREEKIHPYSRIVAILEIYHAMISKRSYKKALSPFEVADHLLKENFGKLDMKLVYTFIEGLMPLFQDYYVQLSNGEVGKIVFINKSSPTRPMVQIDERFINLVDQPQYKIDKVLI
ncbi:MAG: HD-GYP domain-containing protein [Bacillaceae bacterium]|nr:HD-GYP domain-containing protein [Bacillaceae bacterium]